MVYTFANYKAKVLDMMTYYKHQFVASDRTLELYFVGCPIKCPDCHNASLQEYSSDTRYVTPETICEELIDYVPIAKQVHILGGEPTIQPYEQMKILLDKLHEMGFHDIVFFTGYTLSEQQVRSNPILSRADYVKVGNYDNTKPNTDKMPDPLTGIVLATTNQRIIKI